MSIQSTFAHIDPATLITDLRVQRPLDTRRVEELAKSYNPDRVGTIIVSERPDGSRVVIDGQTRLAAKRKVGANGPVHAQVYTGLTIEQEASMFLDYNNSKPVSAIDKFLVRVTEGDPVANEITSVLSNHGWQVRKGGGHGTIQAVNALERAYTRGRSPLIVDRIIDAITQAWGHDFAGTNASLIGGLAEIILRYGDNVDQQKLIREMQATTPRTLLGRARGMKEARVFNESLPVIVGRILHTMHNTKMRSKALPEWK